MAAPIARSTGGWGSCATCGNVFTSDTTCFIKGRSWARLGPQVQLLNFPPRRLALYAAQLWLRVYDAPSMLRRNDVFFLSMLFHFRNLGGVDNQDVYGNHIFCAPGHVSAGVSHGARNLSSGTPGEVTSGE